MRALYQRRKGRDLYDLSTAFDHFSTLDPNQIVYAFQKYMNHQNIQITKNQFEENLNQKLSDEAFLQDIDPLLSERANPFDPHKEAYRIKNELIDKLPDSSRKGK